MKFSFPAAILLTIVVSAPISPVVAQVPNWAEQGPNGIRNNGNQQNINPNSTVSGGAQSIALDPNNASNALIGTTNGGVWRTTDAGTTWTPVTDSNTQFTSLAMGAIAYDATTPNVVVAGYGRFSSFSSAGGAQTGLLRSTDGGATWAAINGSGAVMKQHNVSGVYAAGSTIVAATSYSDTSNSYGNIGLIRSTNGGSTYSIISGNGPSIAPNGLPGGYTLSLEGKRVGAQDILLTATQFATTNGIFRSTDGGATWANVSAASSGLSTLFTGNNVSNVKFAFGPNNTAYAAVVTGGVVNGIYRSTDNGATWAASSLDTTVSGNTLNPGFQGGVHLSITADPTNQNIVYVGGDRTPGSPFGAQAFRVNASLASGSQASLFIGTDTSNNSIPHADTRSMAFDTSGRVWMGNDGGVYRRDNVTAGAGQWVSLNAGLRTTEVTGVAYDRITKALIIGQQDNGTAVMDPNVNVNTAFASKVFSNFRSGDGGKVAADPLNVGASTVATNVSRYSSAQFMSGLTNRQYSSTNTFVSTSTPTLTVNSSGGQSVFTYENAAYPNFNQQNTGTIQFLQPIAVNKVEGGRLYIGTRRVYESINQGGTLQDLNGDLAASAGFAGGTSVHALNVNAMEAGGRTGVTAQPNVLYVGTSSLNSNTGHTDIGGQVFVRPATGAAQTAVTRLTAYSTTAGTTSSSSAVQALAMDTANWQNVYVAAPKRVWFGNVAVNGASSTWSDFTGNLTPGGTVFTEPTGTFTAMSFVPVSGGGGRGAVIVGTSGGLFYRYTDGIPNSWLSLNGTNMPNAYFSELQYDVTDDILIASTLGRGVWTLSGASVFFAPVPEPSTYLAVSVASLGLVGFVRRRIRRETVPALAA